MFLFLFSILPISLITFLIINKEKKYLTLIFIGVTIALLTCGINAFFLTSHRLVPVSLMQNCLYFLHRQTLFPIFILYGFFFIFSRDTLEFKTKAFFPYIVSFYMIYMPFFFLKGHDVNYSATELFIFPLLHFTMLFTISVLLNQFTKRRKIFIGVNTILIIIYLLIPAFIESLFLLNIEPVIRIILTIVYILIPFTGFIIDMFVHANKSIIKD